MLNSAVRRLAPSALRAGGAYLGSAVGGPAGALAGGKAGAFVSKVLGFGDYSIKNNSLISGTVPQFASGSGSNRVCHREFLGDVSGSTSFGIQYTIPLAPGQGYLPWLDAIAKNYQEFKVRGMVFYFRTSSATAVASTNTALGVVIMATNYDIAEPAFSTKQQMEGSYFANSGIPCADLIHAIECDPSVLSYGVYKIAHYGEDSVDPSLYSMGNFYLATSGMQAVSTIGELWVSYDVELLKPRLYPNVYDKGVHIYGGAWSTTVPFPSPTTVGFPGITISTTTLTNDTINFTLQDYVGTRFFVFVLWHYSSITSETGTWTFNATSTSQPLWLRNLSAGGPHSAPIAASTSNNRILMGIFQVNSTSANLRVSGLTAMVATPDYYDILILPVSGNALP